MLVILYAKEVVQAFAMSQGHEQYFGAIGLVSSLVAYTVGKIFIINHGLGIKGWVISRGLISSFELAGGMYLITRCHPKTKGLVPLVKHSQPLLSK